MYYHTLNEELRRRFGCKVYKLALDGGFTCPNRDGAIDTRGCIFCAGDGSGAFAADRALDIPQQIEAAKARVRAKNGGGKYIAYFQNFTNTYGSLARMEALFTQALAPEDVVALSVATRPDCLGAPVMEILTRTARVKPVWVELGVQTVHDETAARLNRCYPTSLFFSAAEQLAQAGLPVIAHLILGLPGETAAMMTQSVDAVCRAPVSGLKLALLHVLRGTPLEEAYHKGLVPYYSLDAYADLLCSLLSRVPASVVLHRLTGDGDRRLLLSPLWSADKKRVLNAIHAAFVRDDLTQGSAL